MPSSEVPFPKSRSGRFFLALFISVILPIVFFFGIALIKSAHGEIGTGCNEGGVGTCSPFNEASFSLAVYMLLTVLTLGAPVLVPTLVLWAIFEFAIWVSKKRATQNISGQ